MVLDTLKTLLSRDVAVAGGPILSCEVSAFEIEEQAIGRAVLKRKREFRAGRAYAREALSILGLKPCPIPVGEQRQPVWPPGVVGSITHTDRLSFAIAARSVNVRALGIDIERDTALDPDLISLVCRPEELDEDGRSGHSVVDRAKLLFVIKEAFFKAYFPATGAFLEFEDVSVAIDVRNQSFRAKIVAPSRPTLTGRCELKGRYCQSCGHLGAIVAVPV